MIRLAIFDIDGTLYDEVRGIYCPDSADALRQLQERDIQVVVATGRPPMTIDILAKEGIYPDYFICNNGHTVLNRKREYIVNEVFEPQLAEEVYQYCLEHDIGLLWKYPESVYVYINHREFDFLSQKSKEFKSLWNYTNRKIHLSRGPSGGCLGCDIGKLADFNDHFVNRCIGVIINSQSSDLMLYGINKKYGLVRLLELTKIKPEECIAFGDNINDLEIIEYVGIGVCMGNGADALKERSDFVTTKIDDHGVLNALKHYNLLD